MIISRTTLKIFTTCIIPKCFAENPACVYGVGKFATAENRFDTAVYGFTGNKGFAYYLASRCYYMQNRLPYVRMFQPHWSLCAHCGCFTLPVPVRVKLNTMEIPYYPWTGFYYGTQLGFKAIPTNSCMPSTTGSLKHIHPLTPPQAIRCG